MASWGRVEAFGNRLLGKRASHVHRRDRPHLLTSACSIAAWSQVVSTAAHSIWRCGPWPWTRSGRPSKNTATSPMPAGCGTDGRRAPRAGSGSQRTRISGKCSVPSAATRTVLPRTRPQVSKAFEDRTRATTTLATSPQSTSRPTEPSGAPVTRTPVLCFGPRRSVKTVTIT